MDNEVEKTDISSVTPEAIKPRETRRNSTGKVDTRSSPSLLSSEEKLLPHYLRASTSSCHDFCKYGRKHEFDPKNRLPVRPKLLGNNEARDKEQNQAKASSLPKKRNKPDLKPKDAVPKGRLSEPELNQNGPSPLQEIRLSGTFTHPAEGFYEEPAIMPSPAQESVAYLENAPSADGEGSSEEPISIKLVISSKEDEVLLEEPVNLKLETPSPIQKSTTDEHEHTSLTWPEGSSDGSESMELETPFATQENIEFSEHLTSVNQIEGSSEEAADSKLMTSAVLGSIAPRDEPTGINLKAQPSIRKSVISEGPTNVKLKVQTPTRKNIGSTTLTSATKAEKSSRGALNKKMNIPSPVSKRLSSVGANQAEESSLEKNQVKSLNIGGRKKREEIQLKSAAKEKTVVAESRPKVIRQKESEVTGESNAMEMNTPLPTEKTIKIVKPKIMEQKSPSSVKKAIASLSPKISRQKASSPIKRTGIPAQPSTPLKPRTATTKSASILISSAQKTTGIKLIKSVDLSKMGERKVLKPVRTSLSPKTPLNGVSSNTLRKHKIPKSASPVKNQAKAGKVEHSSDRVKEKTLYVIEPKPPSIIPKIVKQKSRKKMSYPSSQSSSSTSVSSPSSVSSHEKVELECIESTMNEAGQLVPVSEGTKRSKLSCFPKGEVKRKPRRTTVNSEHKSPAPHKLKFCKGKVVSPQPENNGENNGLRKLRFKQPKGTSENQNRKGEAGKKNYRKSRESVAADLNPPNEEAPTVVLRHQDVQEKKDTQVLLNNVIEETASKLVETRKSKVKALVGAFETVISLQERKIAPTI